jgi:hypothetical protein
MDTLPMQADGSDDEFMTHGAKLEDDPTIPSTTLEMWTATLPARPSTAQHGHADDVDCEITGTSLMCAPVSPSASAFVTQHGCWQDASHKAWADRIAEASRKAVNEANKEEPTSFTASGAEKKEEEAASMKGSMKKEELKIEPLGQAKQEVRGEGSSGSRRKYPEPTATGLGSEGAICPELGDARRHLLEARTAQEHAEHVADNVLADCRPSLIADILKQTNVLVGAGFTHVHVRASMLPTVLRSCCRRIGRVVSS